jgi:hypothetical protein
MRKKMLYEEILSAFLKSFLFNYLAQSNLLKT